MDQKGRPEERRGEAGMGEIDLGSSWRRGSGQGARGKREKLDWERDGLMGEREKEREEGG